MSRQEMIFVSVSLIVTIDDISHTLNKDTNPPRDLFTYLFALIYQLVAYNSHINLFIIYDNPDKLYLSAQGFPIALPPLPLSKLTH